eukprot:3475078-Ditylum_brightwellii.AAC.1
MTHFARIAQNNKLIKKTMAGKEIDLIMFVETCEAAKEIIRKINMPVSNRKLGIFVKAPPTYKPIKAKTNPTNNKGPEKPPPRPTNTSNNTSNTNPTNDFKKRGWIKVIRKGLTLIPDGIEVEPCKHFITEGRSCRYDNCKRAHIGWKRLSAADQEKWKKLIADKSNLTFRSAKKM